MLVPLETTSDHRLSRSFQGTSKEMVRAPHMSTLPIEQVVEASQLATLKSSTASTRPIESWSNVTIAWEQENGDPYWMSREQLMSWLQLRNSLLIIWKRLLVFLCSIYAFVSLMKRTLLAPKLKDNTGIAARQITDSRYVRWNNLQVSLLELCSHKIWSWYEGRLVCNCSLAFYFPSFNYLHALFVDLPPNPWFLQLNLFWWSLVILIAGK